MSWIASGLRWVFDFIVGFSNSYGIAIILVTILIKLVLLPLTVRQAKSMQVTKEIQPKLTELQKKYKDNPQELQSRTLKLYQEYKYNPLGGCLPLLIQLPILWAFFQVLRELPQSEAAQFFLWNLTQPANQQLGEVTVLSLISVVTLPLLSMLTQFISIRQTSVDPSQQGMMMFMPVLIGFLSFTMPAGLVLYWIVQNLFSIAQQAWIGKRFPTAPQGGQVK